MALNKVETAVRVAEIGFFLELLQERIGTLTKEQIGEKVWEVRHKMDKLAEDIASPRTRSAGDDSEETEESSEPDGQKDLLKDG